MTDFKISTFEGNRMLVILEHLKLFQWPSLFLENIIYDINLVSPHRPDFSKSPWPRDFSWAQTATLCRGVEWTVRSTPWPAKLSTHLGDSQATGCCRSGLRGKHTADCQILQIYNVRKCVVERKTCDPV